MRLSPNKGNMIKIKFREGQGLGNQLWLFASSKSIAEKLNFDLKIESIDNFKGIDFIELDIKDPICNDSEDSNYSIFNERTYYDSDLNYVISDFDENVLNIKNNTTLEGLYQSEKYFFGDLEKLKRYIKIDKNIVKSNLVDKDICVLNIRGGEYKRHKNFILSKNYWLNAMHNFRQKYLIKKFLIVTDDYLYSRALFPNMEIIHNDIKKCYATIYNCSNIIVSNSTFSYFPCVTGRKKNIIAPMYWARPIKNKGRWISPANIYKNWFYQDKFSNLKSYEECLNIAIETSRYYKKNHTILINKKDIPSNGLLNFIPQKQKKKIKNILKYFFPKYIG